MVKEIETGMAEQLERVHEWGPTTKWSTKKPPSTNPTRSLSQREKSVLVR